MRRNKLQFVTSLKLVAIKKEKARKKMFVFFPFICTKQKSKFCKTGLEFKA